MFNKLAVAFSLALILFNTKAWAKGEFVPDTCDYAVHDTANENFAWKFCCLCGDCEYPPHDRLGWFVDENNKTCEDLDREFIRELPNRSNACYAAQNKWRDTCCNMACEPKEIEQTWEPVKYPFVPSSEPLCDLCPNGQFPTKPYTITTVATIPGHPTCEDLYWLGRTGNIPARTCYPVQKFGYDPCGCAVPRIPSRGKDPKCDLCPNGAYPLRPLIRMNNLKRTPSCDKLYWHGRAKRLDEDICQQVQTEAQEPCGCLPD